MRHLATGILTVVLVCLTGASAAASADPTTPAGGRNARVDITVKLGGRHLSDQNGAKVFRVTRQPIEDSDIELTARDRVRNPSSFCGDVPVDVDPVRRTVTVGRSDEACDFGQVLVVIESRVIDRLRLTRDRLFGTASDGYDLRTRPTARGFELRWLLREGSDQGFTTGASTLRY